MLTSSLFPAFVFLPVLYLSTKFVEYLIKCSGMTPTKLERTSHSTHGIPFAPHWLNDFYLQSTDFLYNKCITTEQELGLLLFDRSRRKIALTPEGGIFLPHAKKLYDDYRSLMLDLSQCSNMQTKELRICSIPVMAQYGITKCLSSFSASHPDYTLTITETEGRDILDELEQHHCDFAFIRNAEADNPKYDRLAICHDRLAVVLYTSHPKAEQTSIKLEELSAESFLLLDKNSLLFDLCVDACRGVGFEPRIVYTGTRMENIIDFVSNQMGISLMMERAANYLKTDRVTIVPLTDPVNSEISLIRLHRSGHTAAHGTFWNYIGEYVKK